ncbi:MAG TPA: class I SAM-dependent methyltransferase [Thermoplasmata archaeon]|nr:class I SAM-dependent methyltransferase [Thermoplasmata archaeon]
MVFSSRYRDTRSLSPDLSANLGAGAGDSVPYVDRVRSRPAVLTPAARKGIRQRMLLFRSASLERISKLTGASLSELGRFRRELREGDLPDTLLDRGAGVAFTRELPQGALLYLIVRASQPRRVVETGVRPGYSTAWILAGLNANGVGELTSLGPGPTTGRAAGVRDVTVGQFVPPVLRARWTLALGNSEERLREILAGSRSADLFLYDNGPVASRARFELRAAWEALSPRGVLLAHHIEANSAWSDFCRNQGVEPQLLDPGPPPMGALAVRPPG